MKATSIRTATALRIAGLATAGAALLAIGPMSVAPAVSEATDRTLPPPPADGVMGFLVSEFIPPVIQGKDACPEGPALKLKDSYLSGLSPEERARLSLKENEAELTKRWQAGIFGPNGTNICSQPDMFTRPAMRTVQSPNAWGLDLDEGGDEGCSHEEFTTPAGDKGVDNQEYRVMGCTLEWRGVDGIQGDQATGTRQFHASGEWTQVILLRGVDSLENDDSVEVIYGNTPDRPMADSNGKFLPGASFTISDKAPRNRNVLHGRIANGVLTTDPGDVVLTQTWGQGGARDIRGNRTKFDYRRARLRLTFQPDGSVKGFLGGYRPVFDVIHSPAIGGAGSAIVAGIDCAAELQTLRQVADGIKNPKTGKCEGVSSAMQVTAIPAFVNDVPAVRTAAK
jgi:hypothetical protein